MNESLPPAAVVDNSELCLQSVSTALDHERWTCELPGRHRQLSVCASVESIDSPRQTCTPPSQLAVGGHAQMNGILTDQSPRVIDASSLLNGTGVNAPRLRPPPKMAQSAVKLRESSNGARRRSDQRYSWNCFPSTANNAGLTTATRQASSSQKVLVDCSAYTISDYSPSVHADADIDSDSDLTQSFVADSSVSEYVTEMSACEDDDCSASRTHLKLSFSDDECFVEIPANND